MIPRINLASGLQQIVELGQVVLDLRAGNNSRSAVLERTMRTCHLSFAIAAFAASAVWALIVQPEPKRDLLATVEQFHDIETSMGSNRLLHAEIARPEVAAPRSRCPKWSGSRAAADRVPPFLWCVSREHESRLDERPRA